MLKKTVSNIKEFVFESLTNSSRSCFLNCRKKFYWTYIRRLTPIKPSVPLLVGSLFHNGLELFYKNKLNIDDYREEVQKALDAQMINIKTDEESSRLWQQEAIVMGMLIGYVKRYKKQDKEKWNIIAPETEFSFKIPESRLLFSGKRDLLVSTKNKETVLVEHKTTSKLDASYLSKLPLDNQILCYAYSVLVETKKLPKNIVYNVVQKIGIKQKQNETLQQYYDRVVDEYTNNIQTLFFRELIPVNKSDVMSAADELHKFAREIERAIDEGFFYMNTTQCTMYGMCPYMPLCTKQKDAEYQYSIRESEHAELSGN